jgi:hypothetical protein
MMMSMKKKMMIGLVIAFFLLMSILHIAIAEVPSVGSSSCVTYAQARAQGVKGTDAELRTMGFCPGSSTTNTQQATTNYAGKSAAELQQLYDDKCRWSRDFTQSQCDELQRAKWAAEDAENPQPEQEAQPATQSESAETQSDAPDLSTKYGLEDWVSSAIPSGTPSENDMDGWAIISETSGIAGEYITKSNQIKDYDDEEINCIRHCEHYCIQKWSNDVENFKLIIDDCPDMIPPGCPIDDDGNCPYPNWDGFACQHACEKAGYARYIAKLRPMAEKARADILAIKDKHPNAGKGQSANQGQQQGSGSPGADYSAMLSAQSLKMSQALEYYYNHVTDPVGSYIDKQKRELAKSHFNDTLSLQTEVGRARFAYENAQKKGASKEELDKMKAEYEQKIPLLKTRLQNDVLNIDKSNTNAMWVLSTITKWEDNNKQSYEYARDALMYEKTNNPIMYQRHMDTMRDPGVRMLLMQDLAPKEKIINFPTTETSPLLKDLDDEITHWVAPLTEAKRTVAKEVEKIARGYSLSDWLPKSLEDFSGMSVEENE